MAPASILPVHYPPPNNADADTPMPSTPTKQEGAPDPPAKKRKRGATSQAQDAAKLQKEKPHILYQATFRNPAWSYLHLRLLTPDTTSNTSSTSTSTSTSTHPPLSTPDTNLDPLTTSPLLTAALSSHLGQTGAAIPIDILHTAHRDVWIRVPRADARAVRMGLSVWVGACEGGNVPGWKDEGRVRVAWRVVGEGVRGGGEGRAGDGADLFGG